MLGLLQAKHKMAMKIAQRLVNITLIMKFRELRSQTFQRFPLCLKSLIEGILSKSYAKADEQHDHRQTHLINGENACRMIKQYMVILVHTKPQQFPPLELLCHHMAMHMSYGLKSLKRLIK